MTAGTELLRRKAAQDWPLDHYVPLITDATGKKFCKSEGKRQSGST